MAGRRWTPEEDQILESMISSYTVKTIAKKLGRSFDSVNQRLLRLGLSGFEKSTDLLTMHQLCLMFGVSDRTVKKKWQDHGLRIMRRSSYLVVKQEDLIGFLKDHPEDWNAASVKDDSLIMGYPWYKEKRRNDKKKQYFWTPEETAKLKYFHEKGLNSREISEKLGRSQSSIHHKLFKERQKHGISIRCEGARVQSNP